jgi:hypothetical protein
VAVKSKKPEIEYDQNGNIRINPTDPSKELIPPPLDKKCKPIPVCLKRTKKDGIVQGGLYVGRRFKMGDWDVPASRFGNPFKYDSPDPATNVTSVEDLRVKYRNHIMSDPEKVAQLPNLLGERIACWCIGKKEKDGRICHARILADIVEEVCMSNGNNKS